MFEEVPGDAADAVDADVQALPPGVIFHPASGIDEAAVAQVQASLRRRILRAFVRRGLIESVDAKAMLAYKHSGFSVDAGVCIAAHDRAALDRLPRYCARPPFAIERLRKEGSDLVYRGAKQHSEPTTDKRAAKVDELHLTPLQLIDRIAALAPPPRMHRRRYFGVLAPNSPLRAAVVGMAAAAQALPARFTQTGTGDGEGGPAVAPLGNAIPPTPEPVPLRRSPAHYLWAVLIARIYYEVFPLVCPLCAGQMRIIAFITHSADIRHILNHIGVDSAPPRIAPARGPPLWDACNAPVGAGVQGEPDRATDRDGAAQPAPDYEVDQRVNWCGSKAAVLTGCGSMLRARLPPCDFATKSLGVQVVRQIRKPALVGALTHPTRVILRLERLNFLSVIQQNVGGALPGIGAMANYGGMRYTNAVFAEDEENLPKGWLPHATERHGFAQGANSISLMFANGATNIRRRGAKK